MLVVVLVGILAAICVALLFLSSALRTHKLVPMYNGEYPSVTVIRPVKGLDVGAEENFRAALKTGYPGEVETIFIFDSADDPAYAVAKRVVNEHEQSGNNNKAHILFSGSPPKGRTGKLHAMIVGQEKAKGDIIAYSDSDTRPDENVLRILVETLLSKKGAGSAFVPVVSDQPILKIGDLFYGLLQNSLYAPWALLAAGQKRTLPFIMGQYMVITRECLKAIGGVECASGQLVDDMYIGKCVHEAGLLNVIAPYSLSICSSGLSFKEFVPIYRKWFQFGKNGLPASFLWRQWLFAILFFAPLLLLPVALVMKNWMAAGLAVFVLCVYSWTLTAVHRDYGGARVPFKYFIWGPFVMMLLAPAIIVINRLKSTVEWRGRKYELGRKATLKEGS